MIKNTKKRSLSEGGDIVKKTVVSEELSKSAKKKKAENKAEVQNGQANKGIKTDVTKKLNKENKKGQKNKEGVENSVKDAGKAKTQKPSADDKAELLKKRQEFREKRKLQRKEKGSQSIAKGELTIEQLNEKIKAIESRETLSKTAKRKLAVLKKILHLKDGTEKPKQEMTKKETKTDKSLEAAKGKSKNKQNKANKKKDESQGSLLLIKKNVEEENDDDDEEDEEEEEEDNKMDVTMEESEDEDESNLEDDDDDDGEEAEEEEDEEEGEEEDEDEEEDAEDESEDENENTTEVSPKAKSKQNKQKETKSADGDASEEGKKKRYVLFVGNLPYTVNADELKKHFLTKVSEVRDVRIPMGEGTKSRGFAYVELANSTDYEKGLSLHNTILKGRKLNVQYSGSDKKINMSKNLKLHALRKAGKLAGSRFKNNQKGSEKRGKQNAKATAT